MKHATKLLLFILLVASLVLTSCAQPTPAPEQPAAEEPAAEEPAAEEPAAEEPAAETGECKDEDRVQINWSTIAGFYTDAMESIIADFEATHCIDVNIIGIDNAQLYDKQVIELVGQTGAYDVVNIEAMEKAEFAENGFLLAMDDYIKANPEIDYEDIAPIIRKLTTEYKGQIWGLPYYTYTAGYFGRCDLFEDTTEQEAFKAKYGYDLAVPTTWEEHRDVAEFFTRKTGDMLKGEPLTKDFYGVGLMAGRFQEIQDELSALIWAYGGQWLKDDGTLDVENTTKALKWYVEELLPFAPPAALTVTYDGVMNQMKDGQIAQTAGFFLDQWPNAAMTDDLVPGAKMCPQEAPEKRGYIGAFLAAVSSSSKNPEEAMAWVAYLGGKEAQRNFSMQGGSTTRLSILNDPAMATEEQWPKTGHFATLTKVFESQSDLQENLFFTPYGGKIYNTLGPMLQAAAAGEKTPEQAVLDLAAEIEKICGGPCPINK